MLLYPGVDGDGPVLVHPLLRVFGCQPEDGGRLPDHPLAVEVGGGYAELCGRCRVVERSIDARRVDRHVCAPMWIIAAVRGPAKMKATATLSRRFIREAAPDGSVSDASSPTVAACQTEVADLEPERNLSRLRERVAALPHRVDVALFPEYALTGFVDDEKRLREVARSESFVVSELSTAAREHDVALLAGYVESSEETHADGNPSLFNATTYVAPDGTTATYRKRHLWGSETDHLESGTERAVVETAAGTTGLLTCYDLNFVAESAWFTEQGVDALFVTGAWPAAHTTNWRLLLRARALDGVRWVVGTGRTGEKDVTGGETARYAGNSLVARPDGHIGAALGREPRDLVATLDRETLREQRSLVGVEIG